MKIFRLIPFFAFVVFSTTLSLQSCKQEQKPATNPADTAKTATQPTTPSDGAKPITMNDKAKQGQLIYYNMNLGKVHVACATCHSDGTPKTQGNQIRQGHTLAGVTSRTTTWNGMYKADQLKKYAYGGSLCAAVFQKRASIKTVDQALTADEVDALNEYLAAISTGSGAMTTDLKIQWVGKPTFSDEAPDQKIAGPASKAIMKLPGDPKAGETIFGQTCGTCHSIKDKKIGPPMVKAAKDVNIVAQTVRFGSGDMAFYAKDVLTDQQIADAIAYIQSQLGK